MTTSRLRWIGPTMITVLLSGPAFAAAGLPQGTAKSPAGIAAPAEAAPPAAKPPAPPVVAANAAADESARYAEREQQSKSLEQFKGGEGISIYMGSTVLAVMLVLVVLLVLL